MKHSVKSDLNGKLKEYYEKLKVCSSIHSVLTVFH